MRLLLRRTLVLQNIYGHGAHLLSIVQKPEVCDATKAK